MTHAFIGRQAHFTPAFDDIVVAQHGEITGVEERGNTVLVDLLLESGDVRNGVIFVTGEDDVPAGAYAIPGFADKVESAIVDGLGGLLGSIEKAIDGVESKVDTLLGHADATAGQGAAVDGAVIGFDHDTTLASVTDETANANTQTAIDGANPPYVGPILDNAAAAADTAGVPRPEGSVTTDGTETKS